MKPKMLIYMTTKLSLADGFVLILPRPPPNNQQKSLFTGVISDTAYNFQFDRCLYSKRETK